MVNMCNHGAKLHLLPGFEKGISLDDMVALLCLALLSVAYISHGHYWDKPDPDRHLFFVAPQDTTSMPKRKQFNERNIVETMRKLVSAMHCTCA
jgi:hypothetical protein